MQELPTPSEANHSPVLVIYTVFLVFFLGSLFYFVHLRLGNVESKIRPILLVLLASYGERQGVVVGIDRVLLSGVTILACPEKNANSALVGLNDRQFELLKTEKCVRVGSQMWGSPPKY